MRKWYLRFMYLVAISLMGLILHTKGTIDARVMMCNERGGVLIGSECRRTLKETLK